MNTDDLSDATMKAHANGETAALAGFYFQAGQAHLEKGDVDQGCFLLTQAYVYALEEGAEMAGKIRRILAEHGREY